MQIIISGYARISIHALLAESDWAKSTPEEAKRYFYPRSPCGERLKLLLRLMRAPLFLSTLSLRRATKYLSILFSQFLNFYPRSPCGERRCYSLRHSAQDRHFYPRSPCGERRRVDFVFFAMYYYFYPRSPCGERLHYDNYNLHCVEISIHALLAESDIVLVGLLMFNLYFYPRSPCGERLGLDGRFKL